MTGDEEGQGIDNEKLQRVARLNDAFGRGAEAWTVLDDLRRLKRPILVDFNNVLVNNNSPIICNPQGLEFMREVRPLGDVIVATTASSWQRVHDHLQSFSMWSDDVILMVSRNWDFLSGSRSMIYGETKQAADDLKRAYIVHMRNRGVTITLDDLNVVAAAKPLAPLFMKPFDIPLVDDWLPAAKHPYPGTLPIQVKPFFDEDEARHMRDPVFQEGLTLPEAADAVRQYYASFTI